MKLFDFLIVINLETFLDLSRFPENLGRLKMFLYYIFLFTKLVLLLFGISTSVLIYINTVYIDFYY